MRRDTLWTLTPILACPLAARGVHLYSAFEKGFCEAPLKYFFVRPQLVENTAGEAREESRPPEEPGCDRHLTWDEVWEDERHTLAEP